MDLWSALDGFGLGAILPFLFVITVVVFFHELGHFWVARRCQVAVETFSIGFGRALISWHDRKGTKWQIGWLPLGGYVKFVGDDNAASAPDSKALSAMEDDLRSQTLHFKPLWQRMSVVAAGPVANFLLAILIFTALYMSFGQQIIRPIIDQVMPASAAEDAGLLSGDLILSIDGQEMESFADVQRLVTISAGEALSMRVLRADREQLVVVTPERLLEKDRFGNQYYVGRLGVSANAAPEFIEHKTYGFGSAVIRAISETYFIVEQTFVVLGRIISGRESADMLGGPLKIAQISSQTATLGFIALIHLTAVLSVSIGLVNLFPIPVLDGGHLLFYTYEAIFRRPLPERAQEIGMRMGLAVVLTLFVFLTWNDIQNWFFRG